MSYPYAQQQRYVTPGMLNNEHQMYQSKSSICFTHTSTNAMADPQNMAGTRQMNSSPYMTMVDPTINPSNIPMQNTQPHQAQQSRSQSANIDSSNGIQPQHLHSMLPGAGLAPAPAPVPANVSVLKPKPKNSSKTGGSISSSDDDLEIEDEDPETRPAVITVAKPDAFRDKILWEIVDSVWTPRNKPASSEKIVAAIKFVGEAVRGLREQWKSQNEKLKKAELPNSETSANAPALKSLVGQLREVMETLAARVTKWGHPSILKRYALSPYPQLTLSKRACILGITLSSHLAIIHLSHIMIFEILLVDTARLPRHASGLASAIGRVALASIVSRLDSSMPYHAVVSHTTYSNVC